MLKLHFLNVGHGDCSIVEFSDSNRTMVVDINISSDIEEKSLSELIEEVNIIASPEMQSVYRSLHVDFSQMLSKAGYNLNLQNPVEYLKSLGTKEIFRFISTHPHIDHLSGIRRLMKELHVWNFWVLKNSHEPDFNKLSDIQKADWLLYKTIKDSEDRKFLLTNIIRATSGMSRSYWNEDNITILSPNPELIALAEERGNPNIMSYVLLIEYNSKKFILGGDAEQETWKYIVENHADKIKDVTILKASHHGRDNGYYQPALKLMKPKYTIVSVGKKPNTDATNKYQIYSDNVWSTRWKGNILFEIDSNGSLRFSFHQNKKMKEFL